MFIWSSCAARNRVIALRDPFKSPISFKYFNQGHLKKETVVWTGVLHLEAMMERNVYASATPGMERAACPHLLYPHIHNFAKTIICNCNGEFGSHPWKGHIWNCPFPVFRWQDHIKGKFTGQKMIHLVLIYVHE